MLTQISLNKSDNKLSFMYLVLNNEIQNSVVFSDFYFLFLSYSKTISWQRTKRLFFIDCYKKSPECVMDILIAICFKQIIKFEVLITLFC